MIFRRNSNFVDVMSYKTMIIRVNMFGMPIYIAIKKCFFEFFILEYFLNFTQYKNDKWLQNELVFIKHSSTIMRTKTQKFSQIRFKNTFFRIINNLKLIHKTSWRNKTKQEILNNLRQNPRYGMKRSHRITPPVDNFTVIKLSP